MIKERRKQPIEDRLEKYIERDPNSGCWLWSGCVSVHGYGQISIRNRRTLAHRKVWEVRQGEIPPGLHLCHRCDTPACVNPSHMFLGTQADNVADMHGKGRAPSRRGVRAGRAKLTEAQVREIRAMRGGERAADTAARFGICTRQVHTIQSGQQWTHLD